MVASFIDFGSVLVFLDFGSGFLKDSWTWSFLDFLDFWFFGLLDFLVSLDFWNWFFRHWIVIRQINQLTLQTYSSSLADTRAQTLDFMYS